MDILCDIVIPKYVSFKESPKDLLVFTQSYNPRRKSLQEL